MALAPFPWLAEAARQLNDMRERLPNAVLLYGTAGTGLYELADAFARSLLCESPLEDGEACGECAACGLLAAGTHPDYKRVLSEFMCARYDVPYEIAENERPETKKKPSREVRIHQIRALSDFLGLNAARGGRRVVVIYPADMVRSEAASALLKSMEEPPEDLIYVLAAEDIDAVLPTIRSRSRLLRVPIPSKEMSVEFLRKNGMAHPDEALAMAGGAPIEALRRNLGDVEGQLSEKTEATLLKILAAGAAISPDMIVRGFANDVETPAFALMLSRWAHDLMRAKSGLEPRYFIRKTEDLQRLAAAVPMAAVMQFDKDLLSIRRSEEHPLNVKQVWESALLKYAALFPKTTRR